MGSEVGATSSLAGGPQARNAGASHAGPGDLPPCTLRQEPAARLDRGPGAGAVPWGLVLIRATSFAGAFYSGHEE